MMTKRQEISKILQIVLGSAVAALSVACDDDLGDAMDDGSVGDTGANGGDTADDGGADEEGAGAMEVSGDVSPYHEGASGDIYGFHGSSGVDLAEGTLEEDGSFTFTLLPQSEIEGALRPVSEFGGGGFRNFHCINDLLDEIGPDARFVSMNHLFYEEGSTVRTMVKGSFEPDRININSSLDSVPSGHVRVQWIFSDTAMRLEAECESGGPVRTVDVDLDVGWNEVRYGTTFQTTGVPPTDSPSTRWLMEPPETDE
jgi:hypothetical protein